jgi:hypothetical protein
MNLGPFRLQVERRKRRPTTRHRFRPAVPLAALAALVSLAVVAGAPSAGASDPGSGSTGSLSVAVRSVSVSPTRFDLGCSGVGGGLLIPNGTCTTQALTVTNGANYADIETSVSAFKPTDHGTQWTSCGAVSAPACTGPTDPQNVVPGGDFPGRDQFLWNSLGGPLGSSPQLDGHFTSSPATPAASANESFDMWGPQSSTDLASRWKVTLTWWAMPPA